MMATVLYWSFTHWTQTIVSARIEFSAGCGLLFRQKYELFIFSSLFEKAQIASFSLQYYCLS